NLLVPVCLSASHIAFGSIRMEPVFMVLGQTSATAAAMAIDDRVAVQDVDYDRLAKCLVEDEQVLSYTGPKPKPGIDPKSLDGIVVDNSQAKTEGGWMTSSSSGNRVGLNYFHDNDASKGECVAVYQAELKQPGRYHVNLLWPVHSNRATNASVKITDAAGEHHEVRVNQRDAQSGGRAKLGEFEFGTNAIVEVRNADSDGYVIADAVQFILAEGRRD
ncbi:FAD-dependent oxidoreductase, partial [Rhodopirellula bahusiensis]